MKKILSMIFIGLIIFSTITLANDPRLIEDITKSVEPTAYGFVNPSMCGPNDIDCNEVKLDIVFVIDSTGSMHDELRTVKEELTSVIKRINSGYPKPNVEVGVVAYRDYPDQEQKYLTTSKYLTNDIRSVVKFIRNMEAYGGGDYEEAVEAGLDEAINKMNWRHNAEKVIILVGDAPARNHPEQNYYGNEPEIMEHINNWKDAIESAKNKGIRIYTASGSGMNNEGIKQWKTIAKKTGGAYINLLYYRKPIIEHYETREIPMEFLGEARESRDYEESTDSIMTNNLGIFAEKSLMKEAKSAGVDYDESLDIITGEVTKSSNLESFLQKIFSKLKFWK
jgi:Mg-chelatase subunit ChlD